MKKQSKIQVSDLKPKKDAKGGGGSKPTSGGSKPTSGGSKPTSGSSAPTANIVIT